MNCVLSLLSFRRLALIHWLISSTQATNRGTLLSTAVGSDTLQCIRTSGGRGLLRHGLNFSTAWRMMRLINGEKDWKPVCMQKVVTLNTCCHVACLTFKLTQYNRLFSEPPTFGRKQCQMNKFCISQDNVVIFFKCGGQIQLRLQIVLFKI